MSENYYPRHTPEHLEVIREQPFPSHDIPRLTREVEGLRRDLMSHRALLVDLAGLLEPHALSVPGLPTLITRIHMKLEEP